MGTKIARGDKVNIKVGDERGSWGIVRDIFHGEYHVAIGGGKIPDRVYDRSEISRPNVQDVPTTPEKPAMTQPSAAQVALAICASLPQKISYSGSDEWDVLPLMNLTPVDGDGGAPFAAELMIAGQTYVIAVASAEDVAPVLRHGKSDPTQRSISFEIYQP